MLPRSKQPSPLPLVNRQFAEVYAQYELGKMQARIADLEFKLFMAELPSIGECALTLNRNRIHCTCYACAMGGRVEHGTEETSMECTLLPAFMRIVMLACKSFPVDEGGAMQLPVCNPDIIDLQYMPWNTHVEKPRREEWKRACKEIVDQKKIAREISVDEADKIQTLLSRQPAQKTE